MDEHIQKMKTHSEPGHWPSPSLPSLRLPPRLPPHRQNILPLTLLYLLLLANSMTRQIEMTHPHANFPVCNCGEDSSAMYYIQTARKTGAK
jgi:hypothetical protein